MVTGRGTLREPPTEAPTDLTKERWDALEAELALSGWPEDTSLQEGPPAALDPEWLQRLRDHVQYVPLDDTPEPQPAVPPVLVVAGAAAVAVLAVAVLLWRVALGSPAARPGGALDDSPRESPVAAAASPAVEPSPPSVAIEPPAPEEEPTILSEEALPELTAPCLSPDGTPLPAGSWLCGGQVIPGRPPSATASPLPQPRSAAEVVLPAPPYQLVNFVRSGTAERVRYETNVVVPDSYGRSEMIYVLADAARKTLQEKPDAKAIGVFAYSSPTRVEKGYDRGRAVTSRDGRGWTGDGTFEPAVRGVSDRGRIYITLGSAHTPGEQVEIDK